MTEQQVLQLVAVPTEGRHYLAIARNGKPADYAIAVYDPSTRRVTNSSADLQGSGVERGPDEWQKAWLDMATADGEFVMSFRCTQRR
jgi:hypothetical protein